MTIISFPCQQLSGTSGAGSTYIEQREVEFVDFNLLNLIKDLGDGDFLDLYVQHVVDEVKIVKDGVPTGYLCRLTVGESNEGGVENSHDINVGEVESLDDISVGEGLQQGAAQFENIDVKVGIDDVSDLEGVETDLDISDNSQKFVIPEDDDSEIDEELRTLRNERRTKLQRKKPHFTKEITFGSAAGVDKGFENIGRKNATSSDLDSDDSRGELDHEVVDGVDLPARRRSKKEKIDDYQGVHGCFLKGACKGKLLVAIGEDEQYINSLDMDSDDSRGELDPEVVDGVDLPARRRSKKCTTSAKNKLCTSKFIAKEI
ncbi:hypothetical protein KY284_000617 [Solanum tuberosum]|nr:hypothetical protein KY284_000617 [Solanum tuberosum]